MSSMTAFNWCIKFIFFKQPVKQDSFSFLTLKQATHLPAGNYMFKVNNRNTRTRCDICLKLTIKHPNDATGGSHMSWLVFGHIFGTRLKGV